MTLEDFPAWSDSVKFSTIYKPTNPQPFHNYPTQETSPNLPFTPVFIYLFIE